jgi:hypothetical protein
LIQVSSDLKHQFKLKTPTIPWTSPGVLSGELKQSIEDQCPKTLPEVKAKIDTLQMNLSQQVCINSDPINFDC